MTSGEDDRALLSATVTGRIDLVRRFLGSMSRRQRSRGHARALARFARSRTPAVWSTAGLAVGFVALVLWSSLCAPPSVPLSFEIEGGTLAERGELRAERDRQPIVRFSDGTQVELGAGARAHIAFVSDRGARVALDEGDLRAEVVHWEGARWFFDVGPLVVSVTGTVFALSWARDDRVDLRVESGSVEVSGPIFDQPIRLYGGKWLTLFPREREVLIRDVSGDKSALAPAAEELVSKSN